MWIFVWWCIEHAQLLASPSPSPVSGGGSSGGDGGDGTFDAMKYGMIAARLMNGMRRNRPFDSSYQLRLPTGGGVVTGADESKESKSDSSAIAVDVASAGETKTIRVRYLSMLHCALLSVDDEQLTKAQLLKRI